VYGQGAKHTSLALVLGFCSFCCVEMILKQADSSPDSSDEQFVCKISVAVQSAQIMQFTLLFMLLKPSHFCYCTFMEPRITVIAVCLRYVTWNKYRVSHVYTQNEMVVHYTDTCTHTIEWSKWPCSLAVAISNNTSFTGRAVLWQYQACPVNYYKSVLMVTVCR
jgi:hypothetical protein